MYSGGFQIEKKASKIIMLIKNFFGNCCTNSNTVGKAIIIIARKDLKASDCNHSCNHSIWSIIPSYKGSEQIKYPEIFSPLQCKKIRIGAIEIWVFLLFFPFIPYTIYTLYSIYYGYKIKSCLA